MKRIILCTLVGLLALAAHSQSMKMVVTNSGEVVGRYVSQKGDKYVIDIQDTSTVPVYGHRVVTYSAANGQGIVYRNQRRTGNINVRKGPSTSTPVVAKIAEPDGVPDVYPCLGFVNGWYKIRINGKVGYVRQDMACWDGMSTF